MPMKTTLLTRSRLPGKSPSRTSREPAITCSTISAADRLRVSPACPVAQKGQFMPQPAWLDTHMVTRSR